MDKIRIVGGRKLSGTVKISGAKNAVLPAMAASLLTEEPIVLDNVPDVWDVGTMRRLLAEIGVRADAQDTHKLQLSLPALRSFEAPYESVKTMRASVLVLGPLLARHGKARVSLPGGCAIGARPVNFHIAALEKLGAKVNLEHGFVEATADGLTGTEIYFDNITVTGTENILMAASLARGETVLQNCAQEPEIVRPRPAPGQDGSTNRRRRHRHDPHRGCGTPGRRRASTSFPIASKQEPTWRPARTRGIRRRAHPLSPRPSHGGHR